MVEMTVLEQIIDYIRRHVVELCDTEDLTPEVYEDLITCNELCERLLYYDYFKESEEFLSKCATEYSKPIDKLDSKVIKTWEKKQRKDLKEKRKDLKQLFKLIVDNLEEI